MPVNVVNCLTEWVAVSAALDLTHHRVDRSHHQLLLRRFKCTIFICCLSPIHRKTGFFTNRGNDQLSVSLVIEHCSGIAKVMGSNYVQAWIFCKLHFHCCLNSFHYSQDHSHVFLINLQLKYMIFLYSQSFVNVTDCILSLSAITSDLKWRNWVIKKRY